MSTDITTIGILGAGKVGTAIARQAMAAGYNVNIAASGDPAKIELITNIMAPGARAMTAAQAVESADVVVLSLPLHKYDSLDPSLLAGHIAVDTMNYWAEKNGHMPILDTTPSSSELVQEFLSKARLVKALNHVGYHELEGHALPADAPNRRALGAASDDGEARAIVLEITDRLGFDAVDAGPLRNGRNLEPDTAIFQGRFTRDEFENELNRALTSAIA